MVKSEGLVSGEDRGEKQRAKRFRPSPFTIALRPSPFALHSSPDPSPLTSDPSRLLVQAPLEVRVVILLVGHRETEPVAVGNATIVGSRRRLAQSPGDHDRKSTRMNSS